MAAPKRIAYLMSRFPKLTETFILYEMVELERLGFDVEIFPLIREKAPVSHPEAAKFVERARYQPFVSFSVLAANLRLLLRAPGLYLSTLAAVLRGTWGSLNFFTGALGIFPKTVCFAAEMAKLGVEHVHAHFANHPALAAFIIRRLTGIPYSFTAHGSDLHKEQTMLCRKITEAEFVVTVSDFNRRFIRDCCPEAPPEKLRVIHCGVDSGLFQPKHHEQKGQTQIICVASFEKVKGHRYLVEACSILAQEQVEFSCLLIGSGPEEEEVRRLVSEEGLEERILFPGPQPRPSVIRHLAESDIFILASAPTSEGKREGIPVVLMEAMASALPVISSRLSGIPELVAPSTGILVPPRDIGRLAEALRRLIRNPSLREEMGRAGRAQVERHFDIQKNTRELARWF